MTQHRGVALVGGLMMAISAWGGDPVPFMEVGPAWGEPDYEPPKGTLSESESWTYLVGERGTLILSREPCSPCEPVSGELVASYNKSAEETAMLIDHYGTPAILSLGDAHSGAQITAFGVRNATTSYRIQLVINDGGLAEKSFALQQALFRMIQQFKP